MTWVLDLDGVVWLGDEPVPGAAAAIERIRAAGADILFLTNNSSMSVADYTGKLARHGVPAATSEVVTSALAAATLVEPGNTVLVCGGAGIEEALAARGVTTVRDGDADVVMVGWHLDFDFGRLAAASRAVLRGARLVATNDDATYPSPDGPLPGCGAILAAVETASGVRAEVAGKPYPPMADFVRARVEPGSVMVGDRPNTDGLLARRIGIRFALVLSGITAAADLPVEPAPDMVSRDLAALVAAELGP